MKCSNDFEEKIQLIKQTQTVKILNCEKPEDNQV